MKLLNKLREKRIDLLTKEQKYETIRFPDEHETMFDKDTPRLDDFGAGLFDYEHSYFA